jgi:hypothetical protein
MHYCLILLSIVVDRAVVVLVVLVEYLVEHLEDKLLLTT